ASVWRWACGVRWEPRRRGARGRCRCGLLRRWPCCTTRPTTSTSWPRRAPSSKARGPCPLTPAIPRSPRGSACARACARASSRCGQGRGVGSGSARRVPLRTGLAVLFQVGPAGQSGFAGVEIDADWARRTPLVLAPQVVVDAKPLGLPALFGLALPLRLDPEGHEPRLGFLLRVMVEIDRG